MENLARRTKPSDLDNTRVFGLTAEFENGVNKRRLVNSIAGVLHFGLSAVNSSQKTGDNQFDALYEFLYQWEVKNQSLITPAHTQEALKAFPGSSKMLKDVFKESTGWHVFYLED